LSTNRSRRHGAQAPQPAQPTLPPAVTEAELKAAFEQAMGPKPAKVKELAPYVYVVTYRKPRRR